MEVHTSPHVALDLLQFFGVYQLTFLVEEADVQGILREGRNVWKQYRPHFCPQEPTLIEYFEVGHLHQASQLVFRTRGSFDELLYIDVFPQELGTRLFLTPILVFARLRLIVSSRIC